MKLKKWRETVARISQAELAEKLGCTQPMVSMIETGEREANFLIARKWVELSDGQITYDDFPLSAN